MNKMQVMVRYFHEKYGHSTGDINNLPSQDVLDFRKKLIEEEKIELEEAIENKDLVKICDGLGDLLYVIFGFGNVLGVDLEPIFIEIHRSNMSKDMPDNGTSKPIKGKNYFPPDLKGVLDSMRGNQR